LDAERLQLCRLVVAPTCLVGAWDDRATYADGPGSSARLRGQMGLTILGDGSLVMADAGHRLRRIVPGGNADSTEVLTLAGNGTVGMQGGNGALAQISSPAGVTGLPDGRLVVSDFYHHVLRVVTP
jgi:hypothetical protein